MRYIFTTALIAASLFSCTGDEDKTDSSTVSSHDAHASTATATSLDPPLPELSANARVFFVNLKDGQTVSSPLKIEMGAEGVKVDSAVAGLKAGSGHHHLLIDIDSIATKAIVPPTDSVRHYHFGNAQTSAEIKLSPGKHTLVLQFADGLHRSFGSQLTSKITVDVKQ